MIESLKTLADWLAWIAHIHPSEIALGLLRVKAVAKAMGLGQPSCPVIIVGGTNGKGSCVAALEKVYLSSGFQTGVFTSPILFRHNEMVRLNGQEAEDELFVRAYQKIEAARKNISLTPFEYHTLAAFSILSQHALDVWILEVGLGGRLDAVNIMDASVALITSIGIDHVAYLGETRELIGFEKAGIFRPKAPIVCGDPEPPTSLRKQAEKMGAPFYQQGKDFTYALSEESWSWRSQETCYQHLPYSQLYLQNLSSALMVVALLQTRLPVTEKVIQDSIQSVYLPGRMEKCFAPQLHIFDVAHNPHAVTLLAELLAKLPSKGKTYAVFSMLSDKDLVGSIEAIKGAIGEWYVAPLEVARGATQALLKAAFEKVALKPHFFKTLTKAYEAAKSQAQSTDRIIIFGSFHTVAAVKLLLK